MHRSSAVRAFSFFTGVIALGLMALPGQVKAFEAFDGRLQAHGFFESQLRFINADFGEQWDMTQWYQVFNLELELDIAPDGFGPLISCRPTFAPKSVSTASTSMAAACGRINPSATTRGNFPSA